MRSNPLPSPAVPLLALIAEPDIDTFHLYKTILVPQRYVVEQAVTGADAFAKAFADPPDIILADTRLPVFDGYALCRMLQTDRKTRNIPIVLVIEDPRAGAIEQARSAGATGVLVKPCLPEALLGQLRLARDIAQPPSVRSPEHRGSAPSRSPARAASRQHQRFTTTTPSRQPPALRCPDCDFPLVFIRSHVGGVNEQQVEQWDHYRCGSGCGMFEYRHRTRSVRRLTHTETAAASPCPKSRG